ncbi:FxsA family protein [Alphaproteobacteria bacterium]|nr:FxsA family protein [Alphaproteobacteria bacterium]
MPFFIIFILVPIAEIIVFMVVGERIGIFTTLLLALLTAIIGGFIVRYQGLKTILSVKGSLNKGTLPAGEFFDGLCLVAAAATLITPGFITDTIGFLLLVPPVRKLLRETIKARTTWFVQTPNRSGTGTQETHILEGEYETIDPKDKQQ